jgi:hypothetical protein
MKHFTSPRFWAAYQLLPPPIRKLADANYALLKAIHVIHRYNSRRLDVTGPQESGCAIVRSPLKSKADVYGFGSAPTPIMIV